MLNLMNRVATANSRQVRTELPEAFRSVLRWIGGTPRLLTFALAEVGGDTWREGTLHLSLACSREGCKASCDPSQSSMN